MSIVKTGIDIIEVQRIKDNIEKHGENFINRIFTQDEIKYCEGKKAQKFQSYAARFASKEAVFKALSESLENKFDIEWKDIEILNDKNGKPFVNLYGVIQERLKGTCNIDISISHVSEIAVASCVVQFS